MYHLFFNLLSIYTLHAVTLIVLCPSQCTRKKTIVVWSAVTLLSIMAGLLLFTAFGLPGAYAVMLSTIILHVVTALFLSAYEMAKTVFLFLMYAQVFMVFILLGGNLLSQLFFNGSITVLIIIRSLIHISLLVLCGTVLRDKFALVSQGIKKGWWPLNLMSLLLLSYISVLIIRFLSVGFERIEIILFLLLLSMVVTVYWVFFHTITYMHHATKAEQMELQSKLLMSQVKDMQQYIENAQRTNHDVRHHNLQIAEYVRGGQLDELLCYLSQYEDELQSHFPARICENLTANNILSAYVRKAEQNGIAVRLTVSMEQNIGIKDTDIVAILANIMENAILGCIRSKRPEPFIELFIARKGDKLVIQCSNTACMDIYFKDGLPKSKNGKGIGLFSILHSAKSYGGETDFHSEGGVFVCRILLKIPPKTPCKI